MSSNEEWSDSDSEFEGSEAGVSTSVLLGLPDGPMTSSHDEADPFVSRAGGLPPFFRLNHFPSPDVSNCKVCQSPMELLVSLFCPFEGSANDRVLYVWGCAKARCRRKEGSIRAFRSLKHNAKYARKLERETHRQVGSNPAAQSVPSAAPTINPFSSMSPALQTSSGLGDLIFGTHRTVPSSRDAGPAEDQGDEHEGSDGPNDDSDSGEDDVEELASRLEEEHMSSSLPDPAWSSRPFYASFYISTSNEYISATSPSDLSKKKVTGDLAADGGTGTQWGLEQYETMHKMDDIFERFVKRVDEESQQVVRYDLSGIPLPYSSKDEAYRRLFPPSQLPPGTAIMVGSGPPPTKPTYNPESVPTCPMCSGSRVFECQLMPNLINLLRQPRAPKARKQTAEERQKELDLLFRGANDGMEWGTIMVFSCLQDCCLTAAGEHVTECWREEWVAVQWEE